MPPNVTVTNDTDIVDVTGKILSPGFVDAHHHLWQTLFKTIESNDTLATYFALFGETGPAEQYFTHEDSYLRSLESLNAGVTTIVDHAHGLWSNGTADAILRANVDSGARIYYGYAIHHLTNDWTIQDQMRKFSAMVSEGLYVNTSTSLGIAFDYFYSAPKEEVMQVIDLATSSDVAFITSHYVGGPFLTDNSPEVLSSYGILNASTPIILSHGSYITDRGIQLLRDSNQYLATTPESELQLLFETHHRSALIQDQAALGVDTNFGFSADLLTQARMWLQRLRGINAAPVKAKGFWPATSPMSINQAFLLATQHGGLALHRPDIGVIAPGAKADLVVFSTSSPSLVGWNDPVAAVLLHAGVGDIEHVLVDGKFVKRDGKLTYPHYYTEVADKFSQAAERIQKI
ncbi:hypothetical protein LTR53_007646 [Teratosphaeriaceae sp. CCFEE 6253]|nr:hypothetical protein LTR53_007646 [Teratosphaeriaceae sp. CCFEE 6253]